MNILFLYQLTIDPQRGGVERVTYTLASWLETKGYKIYFLGLKKSRVSLSVDSRQYYLPESRKFCTTGNIYYFLTFLKEKNIDIVINQGGIDPQSSELSYYCHQVNVKLISVIHNSLLASIKNFSSVHSDQFKKYGIMFLLPITDCSYIKILLLWLYKQKYRKHYSMLCKNSNIVILLSEKFKEELKYFIDNKIGSNIIGLSNPVFIKQGDRDYLKKEKELLYVGRIDFSQKRVDLLLKIWSKLYMRYSDWSLRIVGGGVQLENAIELASKMRLKNIYFEGFQEPWNYYQKASLFCMTSSFEGFPMVLVEAMQYGVIPFAFNSFISVTDIIDDDTNGILIQAFSVDKYVLELSRFMQDEPLRTKYAKAAILKSKEFTLEIIGNKWITIFNDLN
jgi:glycosyltransferase involved in cell wall biosynthesis